MAHPFAAHRQHDVERSRVAHITKGYASGGGVLPESNAKIGKKAVKQRDAQAVEGGSAKERMDRPGRARGGRSPKHKGNNVNVIVAPQGGAHPMMPPGAPPPGVAAGPPPMPPRPMMAPPGAPPPGAMPPPGMAPPGMPPRSAGGRAYAKGGAVTTGPAWKEGLKSGTQVQNTPSGKNDQSSVGRKRVVTYATGGRITSENGPMGPKFDGGAGGGRARIQKEERADRKYAKAK